MQKEAQFTALLSDCKSQEHKDLLFELLDRFNYVNHELFSTCLKSMADYIVNDTEFDIARTQVVGMTMDSNPDSSDWILQELKRHLTEREWNNVKITPNFTRAVQKLNREGLNQLVLVDEFIGSGQSVIGRIEHLKRASVTEYEIKGCFMAGMEEGIQAVEGQFLDFRCLLPMKKGITDFYPSTEIQKNIDIMKELESELLPQINDKVISDYHLGYNGAEALYSSHGNPPNSIFPVFWWPYNKDKAWRNTILTRNEKGLGL